MNLLFGNIWTVLSTLTLIGCIFYIVYTIIKRHQINNWRKKIIELGAIGLLLCIFVVMRDDYVLSMQGGQGFFAYNSLQIYLCYFIAIVIAVLLLGGIFIKNRKYQQVMFFILSSAIIIKALIIEISRIWIG